MQDRPNVPDDFSPWLALDALQGITEAIFWHLTEGPASELPFDREAHSSLIGLTYAARALARDLNTYFKAASEAGLELPLDMGKRVKETRGPYVVN